MDESVEAKFTPLKIIAGQKGSVLHALKRSEYDFRSFGEAYFSTVGFKEVKGWKKHTKLTSNLVVPIGEVKFMILGETNPSKFDGSNHTEFVLSLQNYGRLMIPPGNWFAFEGMGKGLNLILNIADFEHDPTECLTVESDH